MSTVQKSEYTCDYVNFINIIDRIIYIYGLRITIGKEIYLCIYISINVINFTIYTIYVCNIYNTGPITC